jgi:nucleoside 2-deoxyribosyltransferase
MDREMLFRQKAENLLNMLIEKDRKYAGNEPLGSLKTHEKLGISALTWCIARMNEKFNRIKNNLNDTRIIEEELKDIWGYSLLAMIALDEQKQNNKVVIASSFEENNKPKVVEIIRMLKNEGHDVIFPTEEYLESFDECGRVSLDENNTTKRAEREKTYLEHVKECGMLYVYNMKNGKEYIGRSTAMEIGYALALNKRIIFHTKPNDPIFLSLTKFPNVEVKNWKLIT